DGFSVESCRRLVEAGMQVTTVLPVVSHRTRTPAVALREYAREAGLASYEWEQGGLMRRISAGKSGASKEVLNSTAGGSGFDVLVAVSFGVFLPAELLGGFAGRALNVHPSLLPRYRGAAPIQHALLNGDATTGVTVQQLSTARFDAGRILRQTPLAVPPLAFFAPLHDRLARQGADDLLHVVRNLDASLRAAAPQDDTHVTHARKIPKQMSAVDFEQMSADRVFTLHRALSHKTPLYASFRSKRVQLLSLYLPATIAPPITPAPASTTPGSFFFHKPSNSVLVYCAPDNSWIGVQQFKVEGKSLQDAKSFYVGYQPTPDDKFLPWVEESFLADSSDNEHQR
ncbi:hypothetical protein HK100_008465, partial [Physocladia obscura]